jgi:hypothetical protein
MNSRTLILAAMLGAGLLLLLVAGTISWHLASRARVEEVKARQAEAFEAHREAVLQKASRATVPQSMETARPELPSPSPASPPAVTRTTLRAGHPVTVYLRSAGSGTDGNGGQPPFGANRSEVDGVLIQMGDRCLVVSRAGEEYWIPWTSILAVKARDRSAEEAAETLLEEPVE